MAATVLKSCSIEVVVSMTDTVRLVAFVSAAQLTLIVPELTGVAATPVGTTGAVLGALVNRLVISVGFNARPNTKASSILPFQFSPSPRLLPNPNFWV